MVQELYIDIFNLNTLPTRHGYYGFITTKWPFIFIGLLIILLYLYLNHNNISEISFTKSLRTNTSISLSENWIKVFNCVSISENINLLKHGDALPYNQATTSAHAHSPSLPSFLALIPRNYLLIIIWQFNILALMIILVLASSQLGGKFC